MAVAVATLDHSVGVDLIGGRPDAVVLESARTPWDHAPPHLLTVESGGSFTDWDGGASVGLPPLIYGNGLIDDALRPVLKPSHTETRPR